MKASDFFLMVLNWFLGLFGILVLIFVISFLPALFGLENPANTFISLGDIVLSKGILSFFSYPIGTGILIVSTAIFVWVGLVFSMSSHTMITTSISYLNGGLQDGLITAWLAALTANFFLVSLFVYILFGVILSPNTLIIGGLMMAAMCALLAANYRESYQTW